MELQRLIIQELGGGPKLNTELVESIKKLRAGTSKQGVYKVLKKLQKEGIVLVQKKGALLNMDWVLETQEFLANAEFNYTRQSNNSLNFLTLSENSKISFTFSSLAELDSFWNQVIYILNSVVPPDEPLYAYHPHQWYYYSRKKYEQNLIKALERKKRKIFSALVHKHLLNLNVKRKSQTKNIQYAFEPELINGKQNYYFNIFGEFFIEIILDAQVSKKLDNFFSKQTSVANAAYEDLNEIINSSSKNKLVIKKNSPKAEAYKTHLSKKFVL